MSHQYQVGDKAVYPAHGVGVIRRIETRCIGGVERAFYVFQVVASNVTLMIATNETERTGMRPLVDLSYVDHIYEILRTPGRMTHTTWNRRFREFSDKLRTGSLADVAEVLRDLLAIADGKDLSYGEKKMADKALSMLTTEIGHVTAKPFDEIEQDLAAVMGVVK